MIQRCELIRESLWGGYMHNEYDLIREYMCNVGKWSSKELFEEDLSLFSYAHCTFFLLCFKVSLSASRWTMWNFISKIFFNINSLWEFCKESSTNK